MQQPGKLIHFVPQKIFLTKGVGRHKEKLSSFESALRNAGIARFNLVRVSSIFPPNCRVITRKQGLKELHDGQILFCVIAESATNEPHRLLASSIGIAIPREKNHYGYLSEHHSFGQTDRVAGDYAEDLAAGMLCTIMGIPFDAEKNWDQKKRQFRVKGSVIRTTSTTQSALGDKSGMWTTTVSAAVLL
ncbi:MAG: pyruvoyl-dependent arginine decarboxylase [bacterium]